MPSPNVATQAGAPRTGFRECTPKPIVVCITDIMQRSLSSEQRSLGLGSDDSDAPASLLSPLLTQLPASLAGLRLGAFALNGGAGSPPKHAASPAAASAGSDTSAIWQYAQLGPSPA